MKRSESAIDIDHAVQRYIAGEGREAICESIPGLSDRRLKRELTERGALRTKAEDRALAREKTKASWDGRRTPVDIDRVIQLYESGESEVAVGRAAGVSRMVVRRVLVNAGVELRGFRQNAIAAARRTPAENRALTAAAHEAVRGRIAPEAERVKIAKTRERNRSGVSHHEVYFERMLRKRGIPSIPQKACGRYNIDIAVGPIAVEVFGGGWHSHGRHLSRAPKRFRYLFDQGWCTLIVWVTGRSGYLTAGAVEYLVSWLDEIERDPSAARGYRVIWGAGEEIARGGPDSDELAAIRPRRRRLDAA